MFVSGYSAQITMQSTNFTNIVVKVWFIWKILYIFEF
jgi:hypothetical protein